MANELIKNETIITSGEDYFDQLITAIESAQSSILLESYIFNDDATGQRIIDALQLAAQRDVNVKLLIDGFGSHPWLGDKLKTLIDNQVNVKIFHPLPWLFWQWRLSVTKTYFIDRFIYLFSVLNRRNHRKTCVIDHKTAFIGSFNITSDHLHHTNPDKDWRDTAVRIECGHLQEMESAFENTWNHHLNKQAGYINPEAIFRINIPRRMRRFLYRNLIHRIKTCQHRVLITNAYFIPEPRLIRSLVKAAKRGIQVELLLPSVSDVFFIPWVSSALYPRLLKAGVVIHEYSHGMLHAKTIMIDDWAMIGSSNLNSRSLLHDLEIDYVLQKPENVVRLVQDFAHDVKQSNTISISDLTRKSLLFRALGRLILYLRYWL